MDPKIWGPYVWYNFHILSYAYNDSDQEKYKVMFKSIPYIIPCLTCKEHLKRSFIKSSPNDNIIDRKSIIEWLNNLHNIVNKRLGKKIITLNRAEKIYYDTDGNLKINHNKMIKFIKLVKNYVSGGINSIIFYHGSNILVNYCHLCPCIKCKKNLVEMLNNYDIKKQGLVKLSNEMIKIVSKCK